MADAVFDLDSIPMFVRDSIASSYEEDTVSSVVRGFAEACFRPVTLRANTLVASIEEVRTALEAAGIGYAPVPWYSDALVLDDGVAERAVWGLDVYRVGGVYLQSLSSMLPPLVLAPAPRTDILDMCAAPGGKTSQMAALEPASHIMACELNAIRADKLEHNLTKMQVRNVQVMRGDARKLDEFFSFDRILLDAPCTGAGTVRAGDARAQERVTAQLLKKVTRSQAALLDRALTVLKPGGTLLYSTCSVLPAENDDQVRTVLATKRHRDCELVPIELEGAFSEGPFALPVLPGGLEGTVTVAPTREFEGFYLALIKKAARR